MLQFNTFSAHGTHEAVPLNLAVFMRPTITPHWAHFPPCLTFTKWFDHFVHHIKPSARNPVFLLILLLILVTCFQSPPTTSSFHLHFCFVLIYLVIPFLHGPHFIGQLSPFTFADTPLHVWSIGWVGYVNTINESIRSCNRYLTFKIMTLYSRFLNQPNFYQFAVRQ